MSVMGCEVTISPAMDAEGNPVIVMGFSSSAFSQCVYVPYTNELDVRVMAAEFAKGMVEAGKQCSEMAKGMSVPDISSLERL